MPAAYVPTDWHDLPNTTTPINALQLNRIEAGIVASYLTTFRGAGSPLLDINATTALTDIFSQSIPAGAMGTTGRLRATVRGDWKNNSGATRGARVQIVFGGTTIWDGTSTSLGAVGVNVRAPWSLDFELVNLGSAASSFLGGSYQFGDPGALGSPTAPIIGSAASSAPSSVLGNNGVTIDTASAQTLNVKLAPGFNSVNLSFRVFTWQVAVIYPY